jgi:hypothetical protein
MRRSEKNVRDQSDRFSRCATFVVRARRTPDGRHRPTASVPRWVTTDELSRGHRSNRVMTDFATWADPGTRIAASWPGCQQRRSLWPRRELYEIPIFSCRGAPRFFMASARSQSRRPGAMLLEWTKGMLLRDHGPTLKPARMQDPRTTVHAATKVTLSLVANLIEQSGLAPNSSQAGRLRHLIEAEAWTDVALTLIEIGLPEWKLVRAVVDDGEWCCALSRHWQMPEWVGRAGRGQARKSFDRDARRFRQRVPGGEANQTAGRAVGSATPKGPPRSGLLR